MDSLALYSDEKWDNLIHSLLVSLFFHKHKAITRHSDKDPIQMALILMNMNPRNGNFNSCDVIVGKMSGFLHIMRLVAIKEIRRRGDENPDLEDADFE